MKVNVIMAVAVVAGPYYFHTITCSGALMVNEYLKEEKLTSSPNGLGLYNFTFIFLYEN